MTERSESSSNVVEESVGAGGSAVLSKSYTMRPTFRGVASASSLTREPSVRASESAGPTERVGRHVGLQYLWQLVLTAGPLVLLDLVLLAAVFAATRQFVVMIGRVPGLDLSTCFLPVAAGFLLISAELGLYPGIRLGAVEEFRRVAMAVTSIFAVWILGMAFLLSGISRDRFVFVLTAYVAYLVILLLSRGALRTLLAKSKWWGFPALVCGNDATVVKFYHWLSMNRHLGLRPVGVIADGDALELDGNEPWYAGSWSEAPEIAKAKGAYWAVVVPPEGNPPALAASISENLSTLPHVHILSELTGLPDHWSRHQPLEGLTGIHLQQNLMLPLPRMTKRCMDVVASLAGGLLLLPLLFYIAVAVKMSSRGPILYGHDRIGKDGRRFKAWKFRTMFENSSDVLEYYLEQHPELRAEWEKDHKLRYDPRVTRIGRFIRKTSIDELPQLWNVIRGDMSLVGPRPIVTAEIEKYGPYYGLYTMVTPGITGLWQVSGRNNTTYDERVQLDAYYVRNWSPWMDMYLLVRTIRIVLFADGAY